MYSNNSSSKINLNNYIEGKDIFNSKVLYNISNVLQNNISTKIVYTITKYTEYRPDLISKEIYGSDEYVDYVMFQSGIKLSEFKEGKKIYLLEASMLTSILGN